MGEGSRGVAAPVPLIPVTSGDNEYYLCRDGGTGPLAMGSDLAPGSGQGELVYLGRALAVAEKELQGRGLTFYVTWDLRRLPSYGPDVVAILLGDERCRFPSYSHRVRATFKQYGVRPGLPARSLLTSASMASAVLARSLRDWIAYLPGTARRRSAALRSMASGERVGPVFAIPLGYFNQLDLAVKPIEARPIDISFAGTATAGQAGRMKRWLGTPKDRSRRAMLSAVERLARDNPQLTTDARVSDAPLGSDWDPVDYSHHLMNTKICLAPRGNSLETFRYFEALRYGCAVVAEALPSRWFYDGSPSIQVGSWTRLPALVKELIDEPKLLRARHYASLAWWERVSEDALGRYVATRVDELV